MTRGNLSQTQNKWHKNPPVPVRREAVPNKAAQTEGNANQGSRSTSTNARDTHSQNATQACPPSPTASHANRGTESYRSNHPITLRQSADDKAAHGRQSSEALTPHAKARTKEPHTAQRTTAPGEGGNSSGPAKGPATRNPEERSQVGTHEDVLHDWQRLRAP